MSSRWFYDADERRGTSLRTYILDSSYHMTPTWYTLQFNTLWWALYLAFSSELSIPLRGTALRLALNAVGMSLMGAEIGTKSCQQGGFTNYTSYANKPHQPQLAAARGC